MKPTTFQRFLASLIVSLLVLLPLSACGADPTATPAPVTTAPPATTAAPATTAPATTAVPATTAPAATTARPTTAPATTAPAATTAAASTPTRAATTAAAGGANANLAPTIKPGAFPTSKLVPVPTAVATTPVARPTNPAVTRPPVDPIAKADKLLVQIISTYTSAQGTDDVKLQAARDFAEEIEVLWEDQDEVGFDIDIISKAEVKNVTDKLTAMGGFVDDSVDVAGSQILLASVPLKVFVTYSDPTTKNNFLRELCSLPGVKLVNLPVDYDLQGFKNLPETLEALKQVGQNAKNEGVKILGADKWQAAGITGKGVTVGIIDGGYKFNQQLLGKYLPTDFAPLDYGKKVLQEDTIDNSVHGTAVAEIIYSLAPDAKLIAISVKGTDAEFSEALDYLVSQKVDFVSVSMGNNSTAEDGNSPLSRKIEQINKDTGIVFFFAAGNEGTEHYAGVFNPTDKNFHQFVPNVDRMGIGNPSDKLLRTTVILRWDQWLNGDVNPNATDFDLVIEDEKGQTVGVIDGDQRVRPPLETATLNLPPKALLYLKVRPKDGTPLPDKPVRFHIFVTGGLSPQFITPVMTVGSNADSRGAIAVGAIDPPAGTDIASYSSQGPLSDGRLKPDITAPGGVSSAGYEAEGGTSFPGTSAATPQVSGLAALLKSANPTLTSLQIVKILQENARVPAGVQVPNNVYGYGIADLSNLTPGPVQPKNALPAAPTSPDPNLPLNQVGYYPSPVPTSKP